MSILENIDLRLIVSDYLSGRVFHHIKQWVVVSGLLLSTYSSAFADELIQDERRVWSDGSPQEVWSYDGTIHPDNLVVKELFFESGSKRRQENFVEGVQQGPTIAWYEEGTLELEEMWQDGGRHGMVRHWPDPRGSEEHQKHLEPTLESNWENGVTSGPWKEWSGWGDTRWMKIEKFYVQGELDGLETIWRDSDSMDRKHSYSKGRLDGRQFAWDYSGSMKYQYQFSDGQPNGSQRKYENDQIRQELFFVDGELHGSMTWEGWLEELGTDWKDGLRTDTKMREDGTLKRVRRWSYEPAEQFDSSGYIQFHGTSKVFDVTTFDELGRRELLTTMGEPRTFTHFWPNDQIRRIGKGEPHSPNGSVLEYYEDGTLHREEEYNKGNRSGLWTVYDQKGRVVSVQTWKYNLQKHVVTEWYEDESKAEIKASEGEIEHAQGNSSGRKMGEWKYWTEEGRLLRTETYGPGPYSGNRAFIVSTTQWDNESRTQFEGTDKELMLFAYDGNGDGDGSDTVVRRRTVKLLDRPRSRLESWDSEQLKIVRIEVDNTKDGYDDAQVLEVLGGSAVVLMDEHFRSDGSLESTVRFDSKGWKVVQEGWYPSDGKAYAFTYDKGTLEMAMEWWPDGTERLSARASSTEEGSQLYNLILREGNGQIWDFENKGKRWKNPDDLMDQCQLWKIETSLARP